MKWQLAIFLAIAVFSFTSCKKKKGPGDPIPVISNIMMSPDTIKAATGEDSLFIRFHFRDGDADLGNNPSSGNKDIFIADSRDTGIFFSSYFPNIPDEIRDPEKGLEGTCTVFINSAFLMIRNDSLHLATGDTLQFTVYIKDIAGHVSNKLTTDTLYLRP